LRRIEVLQVPMLHMAAPLASTVQRQQTWLALLVLIGGSLNGFVVRVVEAAQTGIGAGIALGISPFELIAVAVASYLIWTSEPTQPSGTSSSYFAFAALGLLLVPSSVVAWAVVAGFGLYLAAQWHGGRRLGALLFVATAAVALWNSVAIRWFAPTLTTVDAHIVTLLASPFLPTLSTTGNLMSNGLGHDVVLLARCSSGYVVPMAVVAFAALVLLDGGSVARQRLMIAASVIVASLVAANWLRLGLMLPSRDWFDLAHGPVGSTLFDVFQTGLVFLAALWATRS
jgi:hypothetical protein